MNLGKKVGIGNTATVYEWEEGKVLKLFKQGISYKAVTKEYLNAMAMNSVNFVIPKAYEMITYNGKYGIIYDKIEGESLLDWGLRTGDWQKCAECMARLHKAIIDTKIPNLPNYKDFLLNNIQKAELKKEKEKEIVRLLDKLDEGNTLCHGDFHLGNVLLSGENAFVIDFMNICHGNYLYDIARTVYLTEYTPIPEEMDNKYKLLRLRNKLTDLYLEQMNVTRDMIKDYLSVIFIARKGECPDE